MEKKTKSVKTNGFNSKSNEKSRSSSFKLWVIALVVILTPAIILSRFSIIRLNFDKPIKANYIEYIPF